MARIMKYFRLALPSRQKRDISHNISKLLKKKGHKEKSMKRRSLFITALMAMCLVFIAGQAMAIQSDGNDPGFFTDDQSGF